tara:strand:+ start:387 stop:563 length:177 start_codon:yes stop_codon:yes gene_type:complete
MSVEYQNGFQHALDEAQYMLITDVEVSIASFHNDPADTEYQRGFLEGMEAYYKLLGRV